MTHLCIDPVTVHATSQHSLVPASELPRHSSTSLPTYQPTNKSIKQDPAQIISEPKSATMASETNLTTEEPPPPVPESMDTTTTKEIEPIKIKDTNTTEPTNKDYTEIEIKEDGKESVSAFKCNVCDKVQTTETSMKRHITMAHIKIKEKTEKELGSKRIREDQDDVVTVEKRPREEKIDEKEVDESDVFDYDELNKWLKTPQAATKKTRSVSSQGRGKISGPEDKSKRRSRSLSPEPSNVDLSGFSQFSPLTQETPHDVKEKDLEEARTTISSLKEEIGVLMANSELDNAKIESLEEQIENGNKIFSSSQARNNHLEVEAIENKTKLDNFVKVFKNMKTEIADLKNAGKAKENINVDQIIKKLKDENRTKKKEADDATKKMEDAVKKLKDEKNLRANAEKETIKAQKMSDNLTQLMDEMKKFYKKVRKSRSKSKSPERRRSRSNDKRRSSRERKRSKDRRRSNEKKSRSKDCDSRRRSRSQERKDNRGRRSRSQERKDNRGKRSKSPEQTRDCPFWMRNGCFFPDGKECKKGKHDQSKKGIFKSGFQQPQGQSFQSQDFSSRVSEGSTQMMGQPVMMMMMPAGAQSGHFGQDAASTRRSQGRH